MGAPERPLGEVTSETGRIKEASSEMIGKMTSDRTANAKALGRVRTGSVEGEWKEAQCHWNLASSGRTNVNCLAQTDPLAQAMGTSFGYSESVGGF